MTTQQVARLGYPVGVGVLIAAIGVLAAFLLFSALPELTGLVGDGQASPRPTVSPAPTSPMGLAPINIQMSPDANCAGCHVDASGVVGTKPIPVLAHPLEGWRDCTACHADDRLVKTAPGHSSIHKTDCLVCHKVPSAEGSAPPRPHHLVTGAPCISCHGSAAPLPTDMAGRNNCWVCHAGTEYSDLFGSADSSAPSTVGASPGN